LTFVPKFLGVPSYQTLNAGAETMANVADTYGERLRGTLLAPVTGDYEFYIAADDNAELWLSTDDRKFHKKRIAFIDGTGGAGYTALREWGKLPSQRSAPIHLEQGKRYFIEALHKEGLGGDHVSLAWRQPGGVIEVIPAQQLRSFSWDMDDLDDDYLPDSWERDNQIDPLDNGLVLAKNGESADPDGDFITNQQEFQQGTSPLQSDSIVGRVLNERWNYLSGYSVRDLIEIPRYFERAEETTFRTPDELKFPGTYFGTRTRGYIVPQETGEYRFWLSTNTAAELWVSTDIGKGKFAKKLIARMDPEIGTGHGISYSSSNLWDCFASQMSEPLHLDAGQSYYFEILHKAGHTGNVHTSVAWARDGGLRVPLPQQVVRSYTRTPDDMKDDDFLPDAWEAEFGLDNSDNGLHNQLGEGERGDFDEDGLSNLEEYLAGTNPSVADTDLDGETDYQELKVLGTNPLLSDSRLADVVHHIGVPGFYYADGNVGRPNVNSTSNKFRGRIAWNFNVPVAGYWLVAVKSSLVGDVGVQEDIDFETSIDGAMIKRQTVPYGVNHRGESLVITPWLDAGNHSLEMYIDNYLARRAVKIDSIEIIKPGGADSDQDGVADWVADELAKCNKVTTHSIQSPVSPVCLEGYSQVRARTKVNNSVVAPGADRNHWYYNLPLDTLGAATAYTAVFSDALEIKGGVQWVPTNVLAGGVLTVRLGDSLRLGAWIGTDLGSATISGPGMQARQVANQEAFVRTFTASGTYSINAVHSNGTSASLQVTVRKATLPDDKYVIQNVVSNMSLSDSQVDRNLYFDGGKLLEVGAMQSINSTSFKLPLRPEVDGDCAVVGRLWTGGPILDVGTLHSIGVSDALQNEHSIGTATGAPEGYRIVTTPVVITGLPPGGYLKVTIFRAGVTFTDGTTVKTFIEQDLNHGVLFLQFLYPNNMSGGYCHYLDIYYGSGTLIGRR
jgi:hypothetical protein